MTPRTSRELLFELGVGWLGLPTTEICVPDRCVRGDGSPLIELWGLARFERRFAIGAGASLGLWPTTVEQSAEDVSLTSRSYLFFEATARYYPEALQRLKWWVGPGLGVAVVSDRFMQEELVQNQYVRIGGPGANLRTEGLSLFGAVGASYFVSKNVGLGAGLRAGALLFSRTPKTTPLGDQASVSGPSFHVSGTLRVVIATSL